MLSGGLDLRRESVSTCQLYYCHTYWGQVLRFLTPSFLFFFFLVAIDPWLLRLGLLAF